MINKAIVILTTLLFTQPLLAEVSLNGKYASYQTQVNLKKYQEKSKECRNKIKKFNLTDDNIYKMRALPREAGYGLGKLLDDALNNCAQPELFELANSLLILQEQNLTDKSKEIETQIKTIRKLAFNKSSISSNMDFDKLPPSLKEELRKIHL